MGENKEYKDFFISYTGKDEKWALWINEVLEKAGYTTILQALDFKAGANFVIEMHKAIKNCSKTIAIFSKGYSESEFCNSEWAATFVQDPSSSNSKLIPIRIDETYQPTGLLKPIRYIDLTRIDKENIGKEEKAKKAADWLISEIEAVMKDKRVQRETNNPFVDGTEEKEFERYISLCRKDKLKSEQNINFTYNEKNLDNKSTTIPDTVFLHYNELDYYKGQLEEIFEEKINELIKRRIEGDIDGAWEEVKKTIADLTIRQIPDNVASRYFLIAATWTIIDYPDKRNEAERYFKQSIKLDENIDTRAFRARLLSLEEKLDEAIVVLEPFDKENVINTALHIILHHGLGHRAEEILKKTDIKLNHSIRHILALCYLQAGNFSTAKIEIQKAIKEFPKSPIYYLAAGIIDYWHGVPVQITDYREIMPILIADGIFIPSAKQSKYLKEALVNYAKAKEYASFYNDARIIREINVAWVFTAYLLPDMKGEADKTALKILKKTSDDVAIMLYVIERGLKLDEEILANLEKSVSEGRANISQVIILSRVYINTKKGSKAVNILKDYQREFHHSEVLENWLNLMVEAYTLDSRFNDAEKLLDEIQEVEINIRNRIKGIILKRQGRKNELIQLAESLVVEAGTRLDLSNLTNIYIMYKQWDKAIDSANEWIKKYKDVAAVVVLAETQIRIKKPDDCLSTIEKYRDLFENGKLPILLSFCEIDALFMLGKTDVALRLANALWDEDKTESLLIRRARLTFYEGDQLGSISILKEAINQGYSFKDLYIMLAQLLVNDNPDSAYKYAREALEKHPNDPSVYLFVINIGYSTGHDYESSVLLAEFNSSFPDSDFIKQFKLTEIIPMIEEWNKSSKHNWQLLSEGQIPMHIVLEKENTPLGLDFYWRWKHNYQTTFPNQVNIPFAFGGRGEYSIDAFKSGEIFMDYTACLTAHFLDIFKYLKKSFSKIHVPHSLIAHILKEKQTINTCQMSRVERRKKLLEASKKIKLKYVTRPNVSDTELLDMAQSDYQEWIVAEQNAAWIVSDGFFSETIQGKQVPKNLKELQIFTHEVISALVERQEVGKETYTQYFANRSLRVKSVSKLLEGSHTLLVDEVFLETMLDMDCLEIVAESFELLVFDNVFEHIENEQKIYEIKSDAANELNKLKNELIRLKNAGKLICSKVSNSDEIGNEDLTHLIFEMLNFGKDNEIAIWCDDRNINSYRTAGKAPIVGIFDVLEFMYLNKYISPDLYKTKINTLYSIGVMFHLPSLNYMTMILGGTNFEKDTAMLIETNWLKVIRQSILSSLSDNSIISNQKLNHVNFPELAGYIMNLLRLIENSLFYIWTEPNKDKEWREAASRWLLLHCCDFIGDVTNKTGNTHQIAQLTSYKHSMLISAGFKLISNVQNNNGPKGYFKWLFSWLEKYWEYNPETKKFAIEFIINFISKFESEDLDKSKKKHIVAFSILFSEFTDYLPLSIRNEIMEDPRIIDMLGSSYQIVISIEGFLPHITVQVWKEWLSNALDRGAGIKGTEFINDYKVDITLISDGLIDQNILLEWNDVKGVKKRFRILEPYIQYYHSDVNIRCEWLDMASKYIGKGEHFDYFRNGLKDSENYCNIADELVNVLENSIEFFFDKLELMIKSNTEMLPEEIVLFPHNVKIFESILHAIPSLENENKENWLLYYEEGIRDKGLNKFLAQMSCLPIQGNYAFSNILFDMVEKGLLSLQNSIDWCIQKIETTYNPIILQNAVSYLLGNQQNLTEKQLELILGVFINLFEVEVENNKDAEYYHLLYISLLKVAWEFMSNIDEYSLQSEEKRILWSYIYADKVIEILSNLINNNILPYNVENIANTFIEFENKLVKPKYPLYNKYKIVTEVANPKNASVWRIVYGGAFGVIDKYIDDNEILSSALVPILKEIEVKIFEGKLVKAKGIEEVLLTFTNTENKFHSLFNENNVIRLLRIIEKLDKKGVMEFNPITYSKEKLERIIIQDKLEENELAYLFILSRQPLDTELLDKVKIIVEKYRLKKEWDEKKLNLQGKYLIDLINSLNQQESDVYKKMYEEDLKFILFHCPEKWEVVIELLASIHSRDNLEMSSEAFLESLENMLLYKPKPEIKLGLGDFISSLVWWMPVKLLERVHKLRRSIYW